MHLSHLEMSDNLSGPSLVETSHHTGPVASGNGSYKNEGVCEEIPAGWDPGPAERGLIQRTGVYIHMVHTAVLLCGVFVRDWTCLVHTPILCCGSGSVK